MQPFRTKYWRSVQSKYEHIKHPSVRVYIWTCNLSQVFQYQFVNQPSWINCFTLQKNRLMDVLKSSLIVLFYWSLSWNPVFRKLLMPGHVCFLALLLLPPLSSSLFCKELDDVCLVILVINYQMQSKRLYFSLERLILILILVINYQMKS